MSEHEQTCENNAIFMQNYAIKQYISFRWPNVAVSALLEVYIFQISSKKSFITLTTDKSLSLFYDHRAF